MAATGWWRPLDSAGRLSAYDIGVRAGSIILVASLLVAGALVVVGVLLNTAPQQMVFWMVGALAAMAVGLWLYGRVR